MAGLAIKKLQNEMKLWNEEPPYNIDLYVDPSDIRKWYCLIKGAPNTPYEKGFYICRYMMPETYPINQPELQVLTPSGRFDPCKNICLTTTSYHNDSNSTSWTLLAQAVALSSIMADDKEHGVAHLTTVPNSERVKLADKSFKYNCDHHMDLLKNFTRFVKLDSHGQVIRMKTDEEIDTEYKSFMEELRKTREEKAARTKEKLLKKAEKKALKKAREEQDQEKEEQEEQD